MASFRLEIRNDSGSFMSTANITFSEAEIARVQTWLEAVYPPPPATESWKAFSLDVANRVLNDAYEYEKQQLTASPPPVEPPEIAP